MTYPLETGFWPSDDVFPDGLEDGLYYEATYTAVLVAREPAPTGPPTLTEIDRLVFEDLTYTDELNLPGSATLTCPLQTLSTEVKQRLAAPGLFPSEVWVYRDSTLVWAGGVETIAIQDQSVVINCAGLIGYLWRMGLTTDLVFDQLDQFSIAAGLVNHHQALLYGDYGIHTDNVGSSGVKRDRDYDRYELDTVGDLLTQLGAVIDGFDFYVDPSTRELVLIHPTRGEDKTDSVFLDERNIDSAAVSISVAAEDLISDLSVTGTWADSIGTNSTVYLERTNVNVRSQYGRTWAGQNFSVPQSETMEGHADAWLFPRRRAQFQPGVTIVPRQGSDVGDFTVGDTVQYSYDAGLGRQTGDYRVTKMAVQIGEGGAQRISVDFVRFDDLGRTIRDTKRLVKSTIDTVLARLGTHTHDHAAPVGGDPDGTGGTPGTGGTGGSGGSGVQTLGVGGIATPAAGTGVTLITADSDSTLTITTPGVWDGLGNTVKKIDIQSDDVTVQNFYVRGAGNSGIYSIGDGVTIQNCDVARVDEGGEGDINGITWFGSNVKILYNAIGKSEFLAVRPMNGSHTDGIQTWNTPSKRASSNVTIKGNWISGPVITDDRYLHQGIMAEGEASLDGGGGGTGVSENWLVEGNYFKTYGNQCLKFDDIHNVTLKSNTFAGAGNKCVAKGSLSTGITFLADNTVTGTYSTNVGA